MKINLSQNLKRLRHDKNMTQEELAKVLGISFQSISKWERGDGYPDITLLPVIANYFEISIDTLLGNDIISKENKIRAYRNEYECLFYVDKSLQKMYDTAVQAYSEYPYEWGIIDIMAHAIVYCKIKPLDETMAQLRNLCELVIEKCTIEEYRWNAIQYMICAADDTEVKEWFDKCDFGTCIYDDVRLAFKEMRHKYRGEDDLLKQQMANNAVRNFRHFIYNLRHMSLSIDECIATRKQILDLLNVFTGKAWIYDKAYHTLSLSVVLFANNQTEEGYEYLDKAANLYIEIADSSYEEDWGFDCAALKTISMKKYNYELGSNYEDFPYTPVFERENLENAFKWSWFDIVREDKRFIETKNNILTRYRNM
jgi:Predicted transcriptional regulators